MEQAFITCMSKIIGSIKKDQITRQMYEYTLAPKQSSNTFERRKLDLSNILEMLSFGGFTCDSTIRLYYDLSEKEAYYVNSLKSQVFDEEHKAKIEEFIADEKSVMFTEFQNKSKSDKSEGYTKVTEILSDRDAEEVKVAHDILFGDLNHKYKSDKVKAYLQAGITPYQIVKIMALRQDTQVIESYVNSIKTKM